MRVRASPNGLVLCRVIRSSPDRIHLSLTINTTISLTHQPSPGILDTDANSVGALRIALAFKHASITHDSSTNDSSHSTRRPPYHGSPSSLTT